MGISIQSYAKAIFESADGQPKAKIEILVNNLLSQLALNNLLSQAPKLISAIEKLSDEKEKILRAKITTARQLSKKSLEEIVSFIRRRTGAKEVIFTEKVDPKIGGGFIVYFQDTIIDASLEGNVTELAKIIGR